MVAAEITLSLGCGVSMSELHALNPQASTLLVPCHPGEIPDNVHLMAVQSGNGHIVTDENRDELMSVAPLASVFIEFNEDAPPENALVMVERYGLSCPNIVRETAPESEPIRNKEPCPSEVTQANGATNRNLLGAPGKPGCDTSASAGATANSEAKALPRIGVCAHAPGIPDDEWYGGPGINRASTDHTTEIAKATVIFYLDLGAPPESVWHFGEKTKVRCAGKKAPIPYEKWAAANSGTAARPSSSTNASTTTATTTTNGTTTATSSTTGTTATASNTGSSPPSASSSPTGKGPPLSTFETFARNWALGAALVNMDTSGDPKNPQGDRHGMVNGTNVGGWSFPALQLGLSAIQVITAVGVPSKEFVEKIAAATKGGQRVIINGTDKATLKMADELVEKAGQYEVAKGLQEISAVLPFKLGQKFTAGLESKFQAHKIFEKQAFEHFKDILGKDGLNEAIEKAPSVILTDAEHQVITKKLNDFWRDVAKQRRIAKEYKVSQKDLRELYQRVYRDQPHWLQAIEHLLRQVP